MAAADRKIVQARVPFSMPNVNGVSWQVAPGQLYYADDPIVVGREHMFRDPDVLDSTVAGPAPRRTPRGFPAPEEAVAPPAGPTRSPVTAKGRALAGAAKVARPDGEV